MITMIMMMMMMINNDNKSLVFSAHRVTLLGLSPSTQYKVVVYAENGVSKRANVTSDTHVYVRTDDAG